MYLLYLLDLGQSSHPHDPATHFCSSRFCHLREINALVEIEDTPYRSLIQLAYNLGHQIPCIADGLAYTDAMTRDIRVPQEIAKALRERFDHKQLVELTATVAAYNVVSRFL